MPLGFTSRRHRSGAAVFDALERLTHDQSQPRQPPAQSQSQAHHTQAPAQVQFALFMYSDPAYPGLAALKLWPDRLVEFVTRDGESHGKHGRWELARGWCLASTELVVTFNYRGIGADFLVLVRFTAPPMELFAPADRPAPPEDLGFVIVAHTVPSVPSEMLEAEWRGRAIRVWFQGIVQELDL
jgi:hypothetical protein